MRTDALGSEREIKSAIDTSSGDVVKWQIPVEPGKVVPTDEAPEFWSMS